MLRGKEFPDHRVAKLHGHFCTSDLSPVRRGDLAQGEPLVGVEMLPPGLSQADRSRDEDLDGGLVAAEAA